MGKIPIATLFAMVAFRNILFGLTALTFALSACGGSEDEAVSTAESKDEEEHDHSSHDHGDDLVSEIAGMGTMMGDPNATPAAEIDGADLTSVEFQLLDSRPDGFDAATGTADVARHDAGTTVTLTLDGLDPGRQFIAHVHEGSCAENGGDHYKFEADGPDTPPNEIHLMFTSSDDGSGFLTAENPQVVGDDARSIVVHATDDMQAYIACAALTN